MSCPAARWKAALRRRSVQAALAAPEAEVVVKYIVPGYLTKDQWTDLIQDDVDDAVAEVMDELMSQVMEDCENLYLKKQVNLKTEDKSVSD